MRKSKWTLAALCITIGLTVSSWASDSHSLSPDPVKDCPTGLVCFTVTEAQTMAKRNALTQERLNILEAKKPHVFGAFWSAGVTASHASLGGYGETGLYAGPLSVGIELYDYGQPGLGLNVAWTKRW